MSQISPPLRILLVGSVVFLAAWFVFLKPGGSTDVTPAASTPAVSNPNAETNTALGSAVQKANGAAAAQTAANAAHGDESQAGSSSASTAAPAASAPASAAASEADVSELGLPLAVAESVAAKKILVMLFWNPKAADDRAVRREMRNVGSRHKDSIAVHVANVKDIARYAPLVPKSSVQQSPSIVVVGKDRQATVLSGYSDQLAIEQVVADALRAAR